MDELRSLVPAMRMEQIDFERTRLESPDHVWLEHRSPSPSEPWEHEKLCLRSLRVESAVTSAPFCARALDHQ